MEPDPPGASARLQGLAVYPREVGAGGNASPHTFWGDRHGTSDMVAGMVSTSISEAAALSAEPYCYLTTLGRVSGRAHEIEIWFAVSGASIFMLSGNQDRSHWVRNAVKHPRVSIRIRDRIFEGDARIVVDAEEDALARRLLHDKYADPGIAWFADWNVTALPVALDLI